MNDNVEFGFDDMSDWEKEFPGEIEFCCEFCGIYKSSTPKCGKCGGEIKCRTKQL